MRILDKIENGLFYLNNPSMYKWKSIGFDPKKCTQFNVPFFKNLNIGTIYDIGSNSGQSVMIFQYVFPTAIIHAFEPLPDCYKLLANNTKAMPNVYTYNLALSSESGSLQFEENDFSMSSSALPMSNIHVENFPHTQRRRQVEVKATTLDDIHSTLTIQRNLLIKIDVQGYEKHVLMGAAKAIQDATLIIIETSFETLYEGQPLFSEIYALMDEFGFSYIGSFDQMTSPKTQAILQQDAMFMRKTISHG